ncbi:hypothetical protein NP493_1563g00020 [Ridgeia piscesae]|uniref:Uncharacterized protein n=1 Tax=Ridgeia piscesae TaxID=27915 RepID=A0AAD9JYT7_RIDPI|nr:hypothetical protein NP493_1563g00020 [Ridgeia piscesae]
MTGYVMFRKDRLGRRGGGVILYIKESIQAYEIKLEKEAECEEAVWCNIVTGKSTLTVGLVYRSPNISMEENEKIHNAIKEVSKRDCIIMGILIMGIYSGHLYRVPERGSRVFKFSTR